MTTSTTEREELAAANGRDVGCSLAKGLCLLGGDGRTGISSSSESESSEYIVSARLTGRFVDLGRPTTSTSLSESVTTMFCVRGFNCLCGLETAWLIGFDSISVLETRRSFLTVFPSSSITIMSISTKGEKGFFNLNGVPLADVTLAPRGLPVTAGDPGRLRGKSASGARGGVVSITITSFLVPCAAGLRFTTGGSCLRTSA